MRHSTYAKRPATAISCQRINDYRAQAPIAIIKTTIIASRYSVPPNVKAHGQTASNSYTVSDRSSIPLNPSQKHFSNTTQTSPNSGNAVNPQGCLTNEPLTS